jgi:hypothetical protein
MEDIAYLNITSSSNEEEKMNAVFDFLFKRNGGYSIYYERLFIPPGKEILFNQKLKDTGFIRTSPGSVQDRPFFHLEESGRIMIAEYGNYLNYYKIKKEIDEKNQRAIEEKENLEMQKLRGEVDDLTNRLIDYDDVKSRSIRSDRLAIAAIILTAIGLVLQWLIYKNG